MKWLIGLMIAGGAGAAGYYIGQKKTESKFMPATAGKVQVKFFVRNSSIPYFAEFADLETAGKFATNIKVEHWEIVQDGRVFASDASVAA